MKTLTICIATVPERQAEFDVLMEEFGRQIARGSATQLLVDAEPRGPLSIGAKRQRMLEQVSTDYVVFFDDDDWPMPTYVQDIERALQSAPDCVGFYELVEGLGEAPRLSMWTNKHGEWMDGARARRYGVDYIRTPFHKTPVRTSIARAVGFRDMRFAEDHDFSKRLKASGTCCTEVFIPRTLYVYRFKHEDHRTKFGR